VKIGNEISVEIQFNVTDLNGKVILSGDLNGNKQNASKTIDLTLGNALFLKRVSDIPNSQVSQ